MKYGSWTVLPLMLGLLAGCKSHEPKPDYFGGIVSDFETLQTDLKDGIFQIDTVSKALNRMAAAEGDLRNPLADLQNSVVELDSTTAKIRSLGKDVKSKEAAFQSNWSEEIKTIEAGNVRRTAEQGRAAMDASFKSLDAEASALGNTYRDWESKVKSIQASLEADLSPANQKSLANRFKELQDLAPRLKESIRAFSNTLEELSKSMKSATP